MSTEQELLIRARDMEQAALAEIYDTYSPELYRYAARLLGDSVLAEECVADSFSRFLGALNRNDGPVQYLRAYLYRIAHNWVTDHYRRERPCVCVDDLELSDHGQQDPNDLVHKQLEGERVRAAIRALTPAQRQVIMLKYLQGWENEEIAYALRKPVGAVKSLQHRALNALRRILTHEVKYGRG